MKKLIAGLWLAAMIGNANAGLKILTHHSRANCAGFNESVSWEFNNSWWLWVNSEHINSMTGAVIHTLSSGWQLTWRNAMYHYPEPPWGWSWRVHGTHYMLMSNGQPFVAAEEDVSDCSIYDGWWDH